MEAGGAIPALHQLRDIQGKTYKELQALAKIHGVKANLSKSKIIDKLESLEESNDNLPRHLPHGDSGTPGTGDLPQDDLGQPQGGKIEGVPALDFTQLGTDKDVAGPANPTEPGVRISLTPLGDQDEGVAPALDAAHQLCRTDVAALASLLLERRKSARLSATFQGEQDKDVTEGAAKLGTEHVSTLPNPEAETAEPERRKSERLSGSKKESCIGKTPRTTKVKVSTALRFERMHQNLFAGQASIETYGKTPRKTPRKTAPAKENVPLPKATPVRPVGFGSSVKSAKRGLTVASKPCALVVQRSNKKPTQVKEFRLSSNNTGKRDGFKFRPYSGPIRPLTPAGGYTVGASSAHDSQKKKRLAPKEATAALASGRMQAARRNAHVQSSKTQRRMKIMEARAGRA